jgi:LPXTG-motif cell wall-anchored protein
VLFLAGSALAQPTTTKTTSKTGSSVSTKVSEGTVLVVDGNNLVVKMTTGEIRHIVAGENQRALIDGKEVAAKDLKVGTKLKATVTTTTTSVLDRTVTVGSGKVWYVAGNNVILTLPNGENRQYKVANDYKFKVNGQPATVFELKKGMTVSAEKIVEEPRTEVAANTVVTGEAPAAVKTETAAAPAPKSSPAPVAKAAPAPAKLPKTGSPLPLIGLAGAALTAGSLALRALRRRG